MMKRIIAVFLCTVLLGTAAVPAFAAEKGLDEELARVTKTVKETLGIGDRYTGFDGQLTDEGANSYWDLSWTSDEERLRVSADESGKVLYYNMVTNASNEGDFGYAPIFAKVNKDDALPAAKAFMKKVLGEGETASFNDYESGYETSAVVSFRFGGTIMLKGLKSPITFNVRVSADDMSVTSFRRSDSYNRYSGDIPSSKAAVSSGAAAGLLAGTIEMELRYVLSEDGKAAVLRYQPIYTGNYIVRADNGKLVNLDEPVDDEDFYGGMVGGMGSGAADSAEKAKTGLSKVEENAISSMGGVLPKEKLDAAVRAVSGLGISDGFTLDSASYSKSAEADGIYCELDYVKKVSDTAAIKKRVPEYFREMTEVGETVFPIYINKLITVDAVTGSLIRIETGLDAGGYNDTKVLNAKKLADKAAEFLGENFNDNYSLTALNEDSSNPESGYFVYSESSKGILFPENSISISINTYDGTVDSLSMNWTDGVTFDPAVGMIGTEAAEASYIACHNTELQYVKAPAEQDDKDTASGYYDEKYEKSYKLILAYQYESKDDITGVDAKTGKAIFVTEDDMTKDMKYNDLKGFGKAQIEALARYGIGFPGSSFLPAAQLTQKDALVLLLSAVGYENEDQNILYEVANENNLAVSERDPEKLLTRAEFVKMLVGATKYGAAAELQGLFRCGFSDDADISQEYYGYAAIAKALGIVKGDSNHNFNPDRIITRREAAVMLYNFMSR